MARLIKLKERVEGVEQGGDYIQTTEVLAQREVGVLLNQSGEVVLQVKAGHEGDYHLSYLTKLSDGEAERLVEELQVTLSQHRERFG